MNKKALITGVTGQDGSYLADSLLDKGYEVYGLVRRVAIEDPRARFSRIEQILDHPNFHLCHGSLESYDAIFRVVNEIRPDECYHLAAQSFVKESFEDEFSTMEINERGTHRLLATLWKVVPQCRFYFAASSEMFGMVKESVQTEKTPFHPRSPYAISKVMGFYLTQYYRERGMFACSGILFNHESPRRGKEFVTRKIAEGVAKIKLGLLDELRLGNLNAKRDWGFAGDYVQAMWLMLQQEVPDDYVIATGESRSVRVFVEEAFRTVGLKLVWEGGGLDEVGLVDGKVVVRIDPVYFRPSEVDLLRGDAFKAQKKLKWRPIVHFDSLVGAMVESELDELKKKMGLSQG